METFFSNGRQTGPVKGEFKRDRDDRAPACSTGGSPQRETGLCLPGTRENNSYLSRRVYMRASYKPMGEYVPRVLALHDGASLSLALA